MRTTFAAALLAATMMTAPAMAWTAQTSGKGPQAIGQDGGSAAASQATARATAIQGQTQRQGQRQTATGGNATGGNARGGTSNVSVNNTVGGSGGGSSGGGGRAPDVFLPSIGGGGMDCPTVGFGAAGSGLGGGGGFGPSWISTDCNKRKVTALLSDLFGPGVARAYAIKNIDGVSDAIASATQGRPDEPHYQHPAWCVTNKGQWLRNLDECGEDPR